MSLYEKNVTLIENTFPYIKFEKKEEKDMEVTWEQSLSEESVVKVHTQKGDYYLNSRYEARLWANQWAEQFENVSYRTKFFVLGIGNGMYLRALREKYPDNTIVCCEIYPELEESELGNIDFKEIIDDRILLVMGKERMVHFRAYLAKMISYSDYNQMVFCTIPNYRNINCEIFENYRNMYVNNMESMMLSRNTLIVDEGYRRDSFLNNLFIYPKSCALDQLVNNVKDKDFSGRAAIVVSAGPSLDKNVHLLKEAKNKALLIAVDAAAKAMIKVGVCPDLIATIDPVKDETLLQQEELINCAMVASVYSHYKLTKQHKGTLYFPTSENDYLMQVYVENGHEKYKVATGGSVANNAYSLAVLLGFNTIVLVGQDLAYPNGKIHAEDAIYGNCLDNNIDKEDTNKYYEVEANDGGMVLTQANMDSYRRWFEEQAARGENRIINATEGGAKIKGTEIKSLAEVIKEFCEDKEEIDFDELMQSEHLAFSEEKQKEIFEGYLKIDEKLVDWGKRFENAILLYHKLDGLNRKGKYSTSEYKNLIERIGKLAKEFNNSEVAALLNQWGNKEEYEVLDTLVDNQKSVYDEVKIIIDGGIKMYQTYIENAKLLRSKWKELLEEHEITKCE